MSRIAEGWRARGKGVRPVVLAGEREVVAEVGLHLRHASHLGYRLAGVYPVGWEPAAGELEPVAVVANREALKRFVASERIERILVCDRHVDVRRWKPLVETPPRSLAWTSAWWRVLSWCRTSAAASTTSWRCPWPIP